MGGTMSQNNVVKQVNQMVAEVITRMTLNCAATSDLNQIININCIPFDGVGSTAVSENSAACRECYRNVLTTRKAYYELATRQKTLAGTATLKLAVDDDFHQVIDAFLECTNSGRCKSCVVDNLSQTMTIGNTTDCQALNNIKNTLNNQLMDQVTQKLTNNQDCLAPLAQLLGASTSQNLVQNITSRITSKISETFLEDVRNTINQNQNITVTNSSSANMSQNSVITSVETFLEKNQVFNTILNEQQWQDLADLYNQQNTVNEFGDTVVKSINIFAKMIKSVTGKVMFFILILTAVVFVGVVIYVLVMIIRKAVAAQKKKEFAKKQAAEHNAAFQTF